MGPLGLWNICTITSAGSIQSFKLFLYLPSVWGFFLVCFLLACCNPLSPTNPTSSFPLATHTATPQHDNSTSKLHPPSLKQKYWRVFQSSKVKDYLVMLVHESIQSKQFYYVLNAISTSIMVFASCLLKLGNREGHLFTQMTQL